MFHSPVINSDDHYLYGYIEYQPGYNWDTPSYVARIYRMIDGGGVRSELVCYQSFGNGVSAEDWMLDKLECPLFTLLSK